MLRLAVLCAVLGTSVSPARAHRVNVFALVERDTIHAEAYFADGSKCRNSLLLLINSQGDTLAAVRTDGEGQGAVPLEDLGSSPHVDLRVVLDASMGHRAEYLLVRLMVLTLQWLPRRVATALARFYVRVFDHAAPRLRRTARRNLEKRKF